MRRNTRGEKYLNLGKSHSLRNFLFLLLGAFCVSQCCSAATLFYTEAHDRRQSLDLYSAAQAQSPLLIYVHGGAWISGDKDEYKRLAESFSAMNVAIINYRHSPEVQHPAHVEDLVSALHFLEKKLSPEKIYLMGHSAGAFNLAYLATDLVDDKIKGFIGLEGIYDLPALNIKWPGYKDWFLKSAFGNDVSSDDPQSWKKNSPALRTFKIKSPWLIVHSQSDELVDVGQSEFFAQHLKDQKIAAKLFLIKKASHFGAVQELFDKNSPLSKEVQKFLQLR